MGSDPLDRHRSLSSLIPIFNISIQAKRKRCGVAECTTCEVCLYGSIESTVFTTELTCGTCVACSPPGGDWQRRGFRGGSFGVAGNEMEEGNLAATYSALAALVALGADLAVDIDGDALVQALGSLQQEDGR